jgi:hypothetical protein
MAPAASTVVVVVDSATGTSAVSVTGGGTSVACAASMSGVTAVCPAATTAPAAAATIRALLRAGPAGGAGSLRTPGTAATRTRAAGPAGWWAPGERWRDTTCLLDQ